MQIQMQIYECANLTCSYFILVPDSRDKCFQGDLNMTSSVLFSIKDNLLLRNHWTKSFNLCLMTDSIWQEIKG